jgi:hypothetical protein
MGNICKCKKFLGLFATHSLKSKKIVYALLLSVYDSVVKMDLRLLHTLPSNHKKLMTRPCFSRTQKEKLAFCQIKALFLKDNLLFI